MALLWWAPIGATLSLAGAVELALLGGTVVLYVSMWPDYDYHVPLVSHRGITHTVWFALLVGGVFAGIGWTVGRGAGLPGWLDAGAALGLDPALGLAAFGGTVGTVAMLAHLVADVITPAGIRPFWPLWRRKVSLSVAGSSSLLLNYGLLALGLAATGVAAFVATLSGS